MSNTVEDPLKYWINDEHITPAQARERYYNLVNKFVANPEDWKTFLEEKEAFDSWLFSSTDFKPVGSASDIARYYDENKATFSPSDQTSALSIPGQRQYYADLEWKKIEPILTNFSQLDIHCAVFIVRYRGDTKLYSQIDPKLFEKDFILQGRSREIANAIKSLLPNSVA